jgi:mono/diheme cytochrome c family protein
MTSFPAETARASARHCAEPARRARRGAGLLAAVVAILCLPAMQAPALGASPAEMRGQFFARTNCARCHSIDKVTASPLKLAPPFRELHKRYPIESLAEAFAEGISTGHPTMPEFQLDADQINDLLSFMQSLQ